MEFGGLVFFSKQASQKTQKLKKEPLLLFSLFVVCFDLLKEFIGKKTKKNFQRRGCLKNKKKQKKKQKNKKMANSWVVTKQHITNCQTSAWIDLFRPFSLKTIVLPLPPPLVKRLTDDGIQVAGSVFPKGAENEFEVIDDQETKDWEEEEDWETGEGRGFCFGFEEFEERVKGAIEELGGVVVPKLTWSCPSDAVFVSCEGNLKCRSAEEIFLLLQSSDLVVHDLFHAFDCCEDVVREGEGEEEKIVDVEHSLVLKKWANLLPGREMRCFVYQNHLKGICQRDPTAFYSFLLEEKEEIKEKIIEFYEKNIHEKFPDGCFVMDVYVDRSFRVWLLDINPWADSTKPLMFEWAELTNSPSSSSSFSFSFTPTFSSYSSPSLKKETEIRIVESQRNIQTVDTMLNRVPLDLFDVGSKEGIQAFINQCEMEEKKIQKEEK